MLRKQMKRLNGDHQDKICIYYAMKANRFQQIMNLIRDEGDIGMFRARDTYNIERGFLPHEIVIMVSFFIYIFLCVFLKTKKITF